MSALSLSLPLARGLSRCSSVVSRDVVTVAVAEAAEAALLLLPPPPPAPVPVEVGCSMNNCGLNNVVVVVAEELELVTALGCTGEDGSSGMAVREGVEALLT